jgi:hypothetical protein
MFLAELVLWLGWALFYGSITFWPFTLFWVLMNLWLSARGAQPEALSVRLPPVYEHGSTLAGKQQR